MSRPSWVMLLCELDELLDMTSGRCGVAKEHRDAMQLFLDTWCRPTVKTLLEREERMAARKRARASRRTR